MRVLAGVAPRPNLTTLPGLCDPLKTSISIGAPMALDQLIKESRRCLRFEPPALTLAGASSRTVVSCLIEEGLGDAIARRLDGHQLRNVGLIAIDVRDPLTVLRGATATIAVNRPIVVMMLEPEHLGAITREFTAWRYAASHHVNGAWHPLESNHAEPVCAVFRPIAAIDT